MTAATGGPPSEHVRPSVTAGLTWQGTVGSLTAGARGKYVYCIIRAEEDEPRRLDMELEIEAVKYKSIAALVSDAPADATELTLIDPAVHEQVNVEVMRRHPILPLTFGTVFRSTSDILDLLRTAYDALDDMLTKLRDKIEFTLRVGWERAHMVEQIEAADEDLLRLKAEVAARPGASFARLQYDRLVEAALQARAERYAAKVTARLRDVTAAVRGHRVAGGRLIMDVAVLVTRDAESAFMARLEELRLEHPDLVFEPSGPWPPYRFVNIRLKLERMSSPAPV